MDGAAGSGQSDTPLDTSDNADAAEDVSGQGDASVGHLDALSADDLVDAGGFPLVSGRSYVVTAAMTWVTTPRLVARNRLPDTVTMTVRPFMQGDEPRLMFGVVGIVQNVRAVIDGDSWKSDESIYLGSQLFPDPGKCVNNEDTTLANFELHSSPDGPPAGTARGSYLLYVTDEMERLDFTAVLSAVSDKVPTQMAGSWETPANPLVPILVTLNEPILPGAMLEISSQNSAVNLVPGPYGRDNVFTASAALFPGETYRLTARQVVDLDGNTDPDPYPLPAFVTLNPGLFPQDGFESGQGGTLEGTAALITDADVISGRQSLRLLGAPDGPGGFTAEMTVPAGATSIRATMVETPNFLDTRQSVTVSMAAPGQPLRTLSVLPAATVADGAVRWSLPDGTTSRVMFRVATSGCELGRPVVRIDDLRVE